MHRNNFASWDTQGTHACEDRDAGAEKRGVLRRVHGAGDAHDGFGPYEHIFGVCTSEYLEESTVPYWGVREDLQPPSRDTPLISAVSHIWNWPRLQGLHVPVKITQS